MDTGREPSEAEVPPQLDPPEGSVLVPPRNEEEEKCVWVLNRYKTSADYMCRTCGKKFTGGPQKIRVVSRAVLQPPTPRWQQRAPMICRGLGADEPPSRLIASLAAAHHRHTRGGCPSPQVPGPGPGGQGSNAPTNQAIGAEEASQ